MSLTIRISLLLLAVLVLALGGELVNDVLDAHETISQREQYETRLAAAELANRLAMVGSDPAAVEAAVTASFGAHHLQRVVLHYADGRSEFRREARPRHQAAPGWFAAALPIEVAPGRADLFAAAGPIGSAEVVGDPELATDDMWQTALREAGLLGALGLILAVLAAGGIFVMRREMARIADQAIAVHEGKLAAMPAPNILEMKPLARGLNLLAQRLRIARRAQTKQIESLRRLAHFDMLTDLPNRRQFIHHLDQALGGEATSAESGLVMLRINDLQEINTRVGRLVADQILQGIAQALKAYADRIDGCMAGRLNGSDFAIVLPVGGVAADTAKTLLQSLRPAVGNLDPEATMVAGAAELPRPCTARIALAAADQAMSRVAVVWEFEIAEPSALKVVTPRGAEEWRRLLSEALAERRVRLGEFPVQDAAGRVLYLDCPLHVEIERGKGFESAGRWMAVAQRGQMTARVDLLALDQALERIGNDGIARCVNFAAASARSSDFTAAVTSRLAPLGLAGQLWIDLPEALAVQHPELVRDLAARWRVLGVNVGLEHCGEDLARIATLPELGLGFVRIDARFVRGIATEPDARGYLQGLAAMAHGAGLAITAEGVAEAADLAVLWTLDFDAASGPAVR